MNEYDLPLWAKVALQEAMTKGAYCRFSLILEAGQIVRVQMETTLKPPAKERPGDAVLLPRRVTA